MENVRLNTIEEAIEEFKAGNFVIVVDDEDRENEGDLIIAAEKITPEKVNFMLIHARGVLCAPITVSRCNPSAGRSYINTRHLWTSGTHQSALCSRKRRASPRRTYRGNHRSLSLGRTLSRRSFDGNHERRRYYGTPARIAPNG